MSRLTKADKRILAEAVSETGKVVAIADEQTKNDAFYLMWALQQMGKPRPNIPFLIECCERLKRCMFPDDSPPRFRFFFDYDVRTEPYVEYEGNRNWSTCQKCTEMNLLILLDELKKLEDVGKKLINDDSGIREIEFSTYPVTSVREWDI